MSTFGLSALVVETKECLVETEVGQWQQKRAEHEQQRERAVVCRREHTRVYRDQHDVDNKNGNVSGPIHDELSEHASDVAEHRV